MREFIDQINKLNQIQLQEASWDDDIYSDDDEEETEKDIIDRHKRDKNGRVDSPHVSYEYSSKGSGDKMTTKIVASLSSYESGRYSKLGNNLLAIQVLQEEIERLQNEVKDSTKELVSDLFSATDVASTRCVKTRSFIFQLTKSPEAYNQLKYKEILLELEKHMTPELRAILENLKKQYVTTIQRSAALSVQKVSTESVNESFMIESPFEKIKNFFNKYYNVIKGWGKKYDQQLHTMAQELGISGF